MNKPLIAVIVILAFLFSISSVSIAKTNSLAITSTSIKSGSKNIAIVSSLTITFNKSIQKGTAFSKIKFIDSTGKVIMFSVAINNNNLILKPKALLSYSKDYIINIPENTVKSASDKSGNKILDLNFRTISKAGSISAPTPAITPAPAKAQENFIQSVTEESGYRIEGSIPYAFKLSDSKVRLYFASDGIKSAISDDNGLTFTMEEGNRLPAGQQGADPTVIKTSDGKYRMYFKVVTEPQAPGKPNGPSQSKHKVFTAVSDDGLNFSQVQQVFDPALIASVPEAIVLPNGDTRVYYVGFEPGSENSVNAQTSKDGINFTEDKVLNMDHGFVDPAVTIMSNGMYCLVCTYMDTKYAKGFYCFISSDGLNFKPVGKLFTENEENSNLMPVDSTILKIDDSTLRIYYWEIDPASNQPGAAEGEKFYCKN